MDNETAPAARSRRPLWIGLGTWVVMAGLVALFAFGGDAEPDQGESRVLAKRVPPVAGTTMDGGYYDIDQSRGQWVVINFFATWCPGCVDEHPELVAFEQQVKSTGTGELISVVFNDSTDRVAEFFAENGGDWPILQQPSLAVDFQVVQLPETFLVAPDGTVTHRFQGPVTANALWDAIRSVSQS